MDRDNYFPLFIPQTPSYNRIQQARPSASRDAGWQDSVAGRGTLGVVTNHSARRPAGVATQLSFMEEQL